MKTDHEEQVQRLKQLKEEEIDAVTSATSQARSDTPVHSHADTHTHGMPQPHAQSPCPPAGP